MRHKMNHPHSGFTYSSEANASELQGCAGDYFMISSRTLLIVITLIKQINHLIN